MKKTILFLLVIFSFSCEKDKKTQNPILTGIINDNMYHATLEPAIFMNYIWDGCGYGIGNDSIDLLNDGIYNIRLSAKFLDYNAFLACCGNADCWPFGIVYSISSINKIEIATYLVPFSDFNIRYADTLSEGYRIDTISSWHQATSVWSMDYGYEYSGAWYFIKEDSYLGIRMGDSTHYNYGWIKVGTNSDHNLVFKEYAIEQ
jgi:hypothetical protein